MADLETGLNIPVSAYADKDSAKKAVDNLTKGVLNSLKNGYIEVPAEVKASFNRGSKELDKAQKDVINQWEKMSKEGFSSSEEYLDDLIDKYKKFKSLAGREGKGNSKQAKWLTKTIGESLQPYLAQKRELENIISGFEKVNKSANKTSIKQHKTKTDKRYKGIEKVLPKGLKSDSGIDAGRTNEYEIRRSEVSSYPSHFARQMAKSANEAKKWENASLKQEINKEKANKLAENAFARGGNKRRLTPAEKAKGLSEDILNLLPDLITKIRTSEDEAEISELSEKFFATSKAIFTYSKEAGEEVYSTAKKEIGAALAPFYSVKGKIGLTDGTDKSEASRDDKIESLLKGLLDRIEAKEEEIKQELIKLEQLDEKKTKPKNKASQTNSFANRAINGENIIGDSDVVQDTKVSKKRTRKKVPESVKETLSGAMGNCPCQTILEAIANNVQLIANSIQSGKLTVIDATSRDKKSEKTIQAEIAKTQENIVKSSMVSLSKDVTSSIKKAFGIKSTGPNASEIMGMSQADQEKLRAQRISTFGLADTDRNATATGTRGNVFYRKSAYGWGRNNQNPFENLRLTPGMGIDSKGITDTLQTAIQKNMFNAQTGGVMKNLIGSMTGYVGMPSLEKSRAEAEGLNQVMANIREVALELLQAIQSKETDLRGLEQSGQVAFNDQGELVSDLTKNKEGTKLFGDMEEQKQALQGVLAELTMVDQLVDSTGGNITKIVQQLGFVSPELRKNNTIIQNLNAGLDKNGKALKFQTRTAEVLNYSFQLMARHIGRMIKNWMVMMNPLNMIKKAFQDFASYDVKWQRTMNVIKYNLRRIVKPFMEWLAQQLVNIIGLVNAIMKGIGKAFGKDWDLFDQSAASAEQMREELEAAANVTAGFDELHDIGGESSSNPAMDLMGDIYTPQWDGLYEVLENVGEVVGKIINAVSNWSFWDWLKLAGAALVGFLVLKTLINWFTGKNPLESVAKGFSFLEKAVGWAVLIWAFSEFTKALTKFVETMKSASWEDIAKTLITLAGAFSILVGSIVLLSKMVAADWTTLLGMAALVAVLDLLVVALIPFMNALKEVTTEQLMTGLIFLAGALVAVATSVGILAAVVTGVASTGIGLAALGILAGILAVVSLVIVAMAKFVKELGKAGEGIKKICEGIAEVVETVFTGIVEVLTVAGEIIPVIIGSIGEAISAIVYSVGDVISTVIQTICTGIQGTISAVAQAITTVLKAVADIITRTFKTVGDVIIGIINAIATAIETILTPILEFVDSVISKIVELTEIISTNIGETICSVIQTVGEVIIRIIQELLGLIPTLLSSILNFIAGIGPAIESSVDAIMRTITKLINFVISGIEYVVNTLVIDSINAAISTVTWGAFPHVFDRIEIARFVPQYEQGTNYVPNDGLAYLHQGEAVVPKKYNQPLNNGMSAEEKAYMYQMMTTMKSLDDTMKQGISVNGQFVQRGSDLVAVVNKTKSQIGSDLLSNVAYAR